MMQFGQALKIFFLFTLFFCFFSIRLASQVELNSQIINVRPPHAQRVPKVDTEGKKCSVYVISASRPFNVDYSSNLILKLLHANQKFNISLKLQIYLFDSDFPTRRIHLNELAVPIIRGKNGNSMLEGLDESRDKYHDSMSRLRWRVKEVFDYLTVLNHSFMLSRKFPNVVILEDDVDISADFPNRVHKMITHKSEWFAWMLLNTNAHHRVEHGQPITFDACTQGLIFKATQLEPLIDYMSQHILDGPIDFLLRDFFKSSRSAILVAQPSVVQHIGIVSTLETKNVFEPKPEIRFCKAVDWIKS
jgi:hypothetical protein